MKKTSVISEKLEKLKFSALSNILEREKLEGLEITKIDKDVIPSTGKQVYRFWASKPEKANEPSYPLVLDDEGKTVELETLPEKERLRLFVPGSVFVRPEDIFRPEVIKPAITINPKVNNLVLDPGDSEKETIIVTVPEGWLLPKADIYFLADNTGSMGSIIEEVKTGAHNILNQLNALGLDLAYGVGHYRDFPGMKPPFQHQLNLTKNQADVTNAISNWSDSGGGDAQEGQFFALDSLAQPPGGSIGWRVGAERIIVWMGDCPGHDPICKEISGLTYDITESSVTSKLKKEGITALAISTTTSCYNGLDGDPTLYPYNYESTCTINGAAGQATRIASATNGVHKVGIDATTIVNTIIKIVTSAVSHIGNVKLVAAGMSAPFVTSINPPNGYFHVSNDKTNNLLFTVEFTGVAPCSDHDKTYSGAIEVVVDGVVVTGKKVTVTVPQCLNHRYSVKYVCGVNKESEHTVRPGIYSTDINIHNYHDEVVRVKKYVVPTVIGEKAIAREPRFMQSKKTETIVLEPHAVTMDDCHRIFELVFGDRPYSRSPFSIGFLVVMSTRDLNITAVYTATDLESKSLSMDVEQVKGKKIEHKRE